MGFLSLCRKWSLLLGLIRSIPDDGDDGVPRDTPREKEDRKLCDRGDFEDQSQSPQHYFPRPRGW